MTARILVIEDSPDNLDLMTYLLRAFGHTPLAVADGEAGVAAAGREVPDLVLCDVQLPGISGHEVARRLKAEPALAGLTVVAVTAFAMVGDRDRLLAAGFDGYIAKPIDPTTFVGQVDAFLPPARRSTTPPAPAEASPAALGASPARPPRGGRILVVDDRPDNRSLMHSLLGPVGYEVVAVGGAGEAMKEARRQPPDLILSDVRMADGSGYDFIRSVKADPPLAAIPFIFLTATDCDEQAKARGLALGAARFLFRPVEPQALLAEIEACLRERREGQPWQPS